MWLYVHTHRGMLGWSMFLEDLSRAYAPYCVSLCVLKGARVARCGRTVRVRAMCSASSSSSSKGLSTDDGTPREVGD